MAKSKRAPKKHHFAPSHLGQSLPAVKADLGSKSVVKSDYVVENASYIKHDVGKVLILAGLFVAAEIVLWWVFTHTGLGSAVYNSVKL